MLPIFNLKIGLFITNKAGLIRRLYADDPLFNFLYSFECLKQMNCIK